MVAMKIQRQAATPKGILRRTEDADFEAVSDPRDENRIDHRLDGVLQLGIVGLATGARSQRTVETRSTQLAEEVDEACGFRKLVSTHTELDGKTLTVEQLRRVYATRFPAIQLRDDDEAGLIGVAMVHRATLVSSEAAVVIDQRSIPGTTAEHGEITKTLEALHQTYGQTKMLERVTVDAGNMYRKTAQKASDLGVEYFGAMKEGSQGKLYDRAEGWLGARGADEADQVHIETYNGKTLVCRIWTMQIAEGSLGWDGARQVIRIQRIAIDNGTEEVSVGERFFVSSESPDELDALQAYRIARAHWRCENEGHWTADVIWDEDARRTPWTTHPTGIVNVGILRAIAINILALLRSMSRLRKGETLVTPGWERVIEHAFQALLTPALETGEFDEFET